MPGTNGLLSSARRRRRFSIAWGDEIAHPLDDRALHLVKDCGLAAGVARHLERVIAARYLVDDCRRPESRDHWCELGWRSERVAAALNEQHRAGDVWKVTVAALVGSARRMQR